MPLIEYLNERKEIYATTAFQKDNIKVLGKSCQCISTAIKTVCVVCLNPQILDFHLVKTANASKLV